MDQLIPELSDLLTKLDEQDKHPEDRHFLTHDVRFSDLTKLSDAQLQGRHAYYLKDYTFEPTPKKRSEYYREVIRTQIEIRQRELDRRDAAVKEALAGEFGRPPEDWKQAA